MDYDIEAVVVGAGVIGLAVGRELALQGLETVVLERSAGIGSETSSRNSEVIHAGIYYPPGSLKARYCVQGRELLYQYLESRKIPHSRCGKLLVATDNPDLSQLETIAARARQNGVNDLRVLSTGEISELEPQVHGLAGLFSPSTGILDSHQFMLSLQGDFESAGGVVALASRVSSGSLGWQGKHTVVCDGEHPVRLRCRVLINATGLWARDTWLRLGGAKSSDIVPPQYFAKGHYYAYSGAPPFSHLVYPLPTSGGLGVHATPDLAGQIRFGPDVRWTTGVHYDFDDSAREDFLLSIRKYFPGLEAERLQPAYTGIRPKVVGPGTADGDFMILTDRDHGIGGYVSLHGIESPGLTASLAIAKAIAATVAATPLPAE